EGQLGFGRFAAVATRAVGLQERGHVFGEIRGDDFVSQDRSGRTGDKSGAEQNRVDSGRKCHGGQAGSQGGGAARRIDKILSEWPGRRKCFPKRRHSACGSRIGLYLTPQTSRGIAVTA